MSEPLGWEEWIDNLVDENQSLRRELEAARAEIERLQVLENVFVQAHIPHPLHCEKHDMYMRENETCTACDVEQKNNADLAAAVEVIKSLIGWQSSPPTTVTQNANAFLARMEAK